MSTKPYLNSPPPPVKNCMSCGHRIEDRNLPGFDFSQCLLSGHYCMTERSCGTRCGDNFAGWVPEVKKQPKPASWWKRLFG